MEGRYYDALCGLPVPQAQGNAAFSAGNFQEAIGFFTKAIEKDPNNHVLYSNRSACNVRTPFVGTHYRDKM